MPSMLKPCATALLLTTLLALGCASGPKLPKYVEPELPDSEVAIVKGRGGSYITVIDGQQGPGSTIRMTQGSGGNKVRLTPGNHSLTVEREIHGVVSKRKYSFAFFHQFEAGHKYEIDGVSLFGDAITMTDKTTGQEIPPQ